MRYSSKAEIMRVKRACAYAPLALTQYLRLDMSGHHKFSNLTQNFSTQRKSKIAAKKAQLSEEMALCELRQALKISQAELAEKLQVKQPAISRLEKRTDMYVRGATRFCEVLKIKVLNHLFWAANSTRTKCEQHAHKVRTPRAQSANAKKNWFLLKIKPHH